MAKILVVEDDENIAEQVRTLLKFEHHEVEAVHDGKDACGNLKIYDYDLILLDWDLPGMSGQQVCKEFRSRGGSTPILMLTGKSCVEDKELGLDSGADDYLTKPFHMKELAARVRALLRRPAATATANTLLVSGIEVDPSKFMVRKNGETINLVRREFALLEFLMRHPNQVFAPEALLNRVWPSDSESTTEALRTAMKRLRKKIDPDGEVIRTVHGVGYILESR